MPLEMKGVALAVADIDQSVYFYEQLGFNKELGGPGGTILRGGDVTLALVPRAGLSKLLDTDVGETANGRTAMIHMARSEQEVQELLDAAENAGGTMVRKASENDFLGFSGVFADLDGHLWNVGYNVFMYRK